MPVTNLVQLITYPDSLGGGLETLDRLLRSRFRGLFPGGTHILPPFPSSGDRGFAPLTYAEIDPSFGTWEDVQRINEVSPVMLDLMVNHMSRQAPAVQDFLARGSQSRYADLFITPGKVWPKEPPPAADLGKLFLRRATPFSRYRVAATGEEVSLWTTFGKEDPSEQVDLDRRSPLYKGFIQEVLEGFQRRGIRTVRLDAVGYVVKKAGTSCFFVEPEIWGYLEWIRGRAAAAGIQLLPEVHAEPALQEALSARGFWTYDFILPYAVLEALLTGEAAFLRAYLRRRSSRQFTMLDCHDGVPLKPDLDGLYLSPRARRVVETCVARGANVNRVISASHQDADGFDVHQIHCSYYDALGSRDDAMVAARAIQLFAPGVPQVYYAGLLAAGSDHEAVRRTGESREINRHNFSSEEIDAAVQRPVVQRLMRLIRLRNEHPAFDGTFAVPDGSDAELRLTWTAGPAECELTVDLPAANAVVTLTESCGQRVRLAL